MFLKASSTCVLIPSAGVLFGKKGYCLLIICLLDPHFENSFLNLNVSPNIIEIWEKCLGSSGNGLKVQLSPGVEDDLKRKTKYYNNLSGQHFFFLKKTISALEIKPCGQFTNKQLTKIMIART